MIVPMDSVLRTIKTQTWWVTAVIVTVMVMEVIGLNGPNVCMVKQKYNITKRVKYRAPTSVRTYEWCFSMPPRCSHWSTEIRDLTRLETEERTAEMAVCCPGYKMKDVSCVPICPYGKTGHGCSEECPPNQWGPNCAHDCTRCEHGACSPVTGQCRCQEGWQGESCETSMTTTPAGVMEQLLTTSKNTTSSPKPTTRPTTAVETSTIEATVATSSVTSPVDNTAIASRTKLIETYLATTKTDDASLTSTTQKPTVTNKLVTYNNITLPMPMTTYATATEAVTKRFMTNSAFYNKTDAFEQLSKERVVETLNTEYTLNTMHSEVLPTTTKPNYITSSLAITTDSVTPSSTVKETTVKSEITRTPETTRKLETTTKYTTTMKFKPKEIWIRPAQKGESPLVELIKFKNVTKKEVTENTTAKTIIVSIIPTSVSYTTFKKIALTTTSYVSHRNNTALKSFNKSTDLEFTRPMTRQTSTATPFTVIFLNSISRAANKSSSVNAILQNFTRSSAYTSFTATYTTTSNKTTNSMSSTWNAVNKRPNSSNPLTTVPTYVQRRQNHYEISTPRHLTTPIESRTTNSSRNNTTEHPSVNKQFVTLMQRNLTAKYVTDTPKITKTFLRKQAEFTTKRNLTTNAQTNTVTEDPTKDEEIFHILTEPEHITAVMGDKGTERSSVDLISVISIAGGVMMAMITVAVVIVMLDRCKRPRYEDVRKFNDIRMQVMIDNNDVPPPYVRSIFHTPLPDPPTSEKCHYQPISTLDRNLKQFMRPVVVQTISPLMLENFRGILECHYDHLPRRSHDLGAMQSRCSVAPSIEERQELLHHRARPLTDSAIEAMKCEAKLDVLDNTTSEPLYAEIPCWRPPSEHAIEIVNLNGEAVTEL